MPNFGNFVMVKVELAWARCRLGVHPTAYCVLYQLPQIPSRLRGQKIDVLSYVELLVPHRSKIGVSFGGLGFSMHKLSLKGASFSRQKK